MVVDNEVASAHPRLISASDQLIRADLQLPAAVVTNSALLQEMSKCEGSSPVPVCTPGLLAWMNFLQESSKGRVAVQTFSVDTLTTVLQVAHFMKDEGTCCMVARRLGQDLVRESRQRYAEQARSSSFGMFRVPAAFARSPTSSSGRSARKSEERGTCLQALENLGHDLVVVVLRHTPCSLLALAQILPPQLHPAAVESRVSSGCHFSIASGSDSSPDLDGTPSDCILYLGPHIAQLRGILTLNLANASIGDSGAVTLAPTLFTLSSLLELHLPGNRISAAGMRALGTYLALLSKLQVLNMGSNSLGDLGIVALVPPVAALGELRTLCLAANGITTHGLCQFAAVLPTLLALECLELQHNEVEFDSDSLAAFEEHVTALQRLHTLNLAGACEMPNIGLENLLYSLPSLRHLNVGLCGSPDALSAVSVLRELTRLDVPDCALPEAPMLPDWCSHLQRLCHLDLSGAELDRCQLQALGRELPTMTALTALYTGDHTEPCSTFPLVAALGALPSLRVLAVAGPITYEEQGVHALLPALLGVTQVTCLRLTCFSQALVPEAAFMACNTSCEIPANVASRDVCRALAALTGLVSLQLQGDGAVQLLPGLWRLSTLSKLTELGLGDLGAQVDGEEYVWDMLPAPAELQVLDLSMRVSVRPDTEADLENAVVGMRKLRKLVMSPARRNGLWDSIAAYGISVQRGAP